MTSTLTHPLVSAYLRDLELLLHGVDPGERAEVLAGVHEHLDVSLAPGASDDDVRRSLAELGSPQSVADEAYAGRIGPASIPPSLARPRPGLMSRSWVPVVVGVGLALSLVLIILVAAMSAGYSVTSLDSSDASGAAVAGFDQVTYGGAFPGGAFWALLILSWLWVAPLGLCLASPLWSSTEKAAMALTLPLSAILVTALPDLGWSLSQTELGINLGAWIGLALACFGSGGVVLRTWKAGSARAEALENGLRS